MKIKLKIKHFLLTLALLYILIRSYISDQDIGTVESAELTPEEARKLVLLGAQIMTLLFLALMLTIGVWKGIRGP